MLLLGEVGDRSRSSGHDERWIDMREVVGGNYYRTIDRHVLLSAIARPEA
jgi:hypothetical protein